MFKIWNDSDAGYMTRVEIDGEEVSGNFQSLTITAGVKTAVEIELEPLVVEVPESRFSTGFDDDGPTRLIFGTKDTRELLIKHGWTPPAE